MKVTNANNQQLQGVAGKKAEKTDATKSGNQKSISRPETSGASELALSQRAKDMKMAKDVAMKSSPDVDEAKVAKFQKLIDGGQYKIDSRAVASKMLDEHLMMGEAAGSDTE